MTSVLYVARHGETRWNRAHRMQGRGDSPLTERGLLQAAALASFAVRTGVVRVVASPLGRARHTAALASQEAGAPLWVVAALAEVDFGEASALTHEELAAKFPALRAARDRDKWGHAWPGGESYADVAKRIESWLASGARELLLRGGGGPTLVVAHQSVNRVLLACLGLATREAVLSSEQPSQMVVRVDALGGLSHASLSGTSAEVEWHVGLHLPN